MTTRENLDTLPAWRAIDEFRSAIMGSGLGDPGHIVADGEIHRFRCADDKPGTRNGWYLLHLDRLAAGAYGSWKTGETCTWSAKGERIDPRQQADIRRLIEQAKRQRRAELADRHAAAAVKAKAMLEHATPADPEHPYLAAKGVKPHGIRQQGIALLIPVAVGDQIASVQTIMPDGAKRFLSGGRITGGSYLIDDATRRDEILIAEGFATAATLHEELGAAVYVAFNAGNLLAVARHARARQPGGALLFCGDNDQWTEGNPGATKAREAAFAIGAKLLMPDFTGLDVSGLPSDWNDWYRLRRNSAGGAA